MANERAMTDAEILAQIPAAEARAAEADRSEPRARSARYDRRTGRVVVELTNGCGFTFPARYGQGLQDAKPEDLARVSVDAGGAALRWAPLDVDLGVVGLLAGVFGGRAWMERLKTAGVDEAGRKGGQARSKAKTEAARRNGARGGRPRKPAPVERRQSPPAEPGAGRE